MEEKIKRFRFERLRWEYVLTTPIFAVAIYSYFCARNMKELSVPFILASAAVLFLFAIVAYFVVYLLIRRSFTAMLFCLFCWMGCYAQPLTGSLLYPAWAAAMTALGLKEEYAWRKLNVLIVLASAILLTALAQRIKGKETLAKLIGGVSLAILCMNSFPVLSDVFSRIQGVGSEFDLKTEFVQDDALASPDIYWIHADGMMGFDAFEKYYGNSQEALAAALADRGFEISRSANFEAGHSTSVAVPMLTSPYAYDAWMFQYKVSPKVRDMLAVLRRKAELQKAFSDKGYTVNAIGTDGYFYAPDGGYFWPKYDMYRVWKQGGKAEAAVISIQGKLRNIARINLFFGWCCKKIIEMIGSSTDYIEISDSRAYMPDEKAKEVLLNAYQNVDNETFQDVWGLYDLLNGGYDSPRLTLVHNLTAHHPFQFNEDGSIHEASESPLDYYAQHMYTGKVVIGMADMILEAAPDAIIIIQADHGLHMNTEEDFKQAFGADADAVEIWNSTISAVRVPARYQTGEEHYMMDTPLNIARYLVNNFVGRNYEYLVPVQP